MLPCRSGCPSYHEGCHKDLCQLAAVPGGTNAQRQAKKQYLQFYNTLSAQVVRQYRAIQCRRAAW